MVTQLKNFPQAERLHNRLTIKFQLKIKWLVFLLTVLGNLALMPPAVAAFDHFYVEPQVSSDKLKVNSGKFNLVASGFKAGFYMIPKLSFEVLIAKGSREDQINDLTVQLKSRSSYFVRWGSDYHRPIRAYLSLGQTNLQVKYTGPLSETTDKLSDLAWAVGAEERIRAIPGSFFNLEYVRHFSNIDQIYSSISMGLRYEF